MSELTDWYKSISFFTRYWITLTLIFSLIGRFRIIDYKHFFLEYDEFINQFQIWRPLTGLFFYPMSFSLLLNIYFLYHYSQRLETGMFAYKPADFFFMLIFNWLCCVIIGFLVGLRFLMDPMVLSVVYVWCQLNRDVIVTFWFGTRFKAMYLPWVLLLFNFVVGDSGLMDLLGILVGHLAFFLLFKYPQEFGGPALLTPPAFLKQLFPDTRVPGQFGPTPQARAQTTTFGGHNWGRGHTLGGN